jgi:Type I phosphodiesterase / nucleotide pyrophosphatase
MMRIRRGYIKRLLAGAVFGLYMGHLLYYLNPQIDLTPGRLALVTVAYGVIWSLLLGSFLWLLRVVRVKIFSRPEGGGYRQHGFGFVVAAALVSTALYWYHLAFLRIYLPPGAIRILSKATTLIGATAFVLLILWLFERNAREAVSNAILVIACAVIAICVFFLYERRDRYRPGGPPVVAHVVVGEERPVVAIAIGDLPYDWIVTMVGEGSLPFFADAQSRAFLTRVEPFPTTSPKALWASLVTGKLPYRHGVTGRFSYTMPLTGGANRILLLPRWIGFGIWGLIPPVRRISAQLPAGDSLPLWSMFERVAARSAVLDWPAARPKTQTASVVISPDFFAHPGEPDTIRPPEIERIASEELDEARGGFEALRPKIPQRVAAPLLAAVAADTASLRTAATLARSRKFALTLVAVDSLDEATDRLRLRGNTLPPRSTREGEAIRAIVQELDAQLGALRQEIGEEALLVVISPSAPSPPSLPASAGALFDRLLQTEEIGADEGLLIIEGAGVAHRDNPQPARVVDLVPTILFASGLPIANDLDGRVLTEAFQDQLLTTRSVSVIESYEARRFSVQRSVSH